MNEAEMAERMQDVIAFLTARWKDDEDAGRRIVGMKGGADEHYEYTVEEWVEVANNTSDLLVAMTDFALSNIQTLALMVGCSTERMIEGLALSMARIT